MARPIEDRIKELQEKQEKTEKRQNQLKAQEKALRAKQSEAKRKKDAHEKIILGSVIKSFLYRPYEEGDADRLYQFIKGQEERGNYFSKAMKTEKDEEEKSELNPS